MADEKRVKVRPLSAAEFREGLEVGWTGKLMDIHFVNNTAAPELRPGTLVEVQSAPRLYLGVLQENRGSDVSILVEHMLDRSEIHWIEDVWG